MPTHERGDRIAKYLAHCGVGSRRRVEAEYIAAGRVSVNGRVVTTPATTVRPGSVVRVDGRTVRREDLVTLALHKPVDVVSTVRDPAGRLTVLDLIPDPPVRLYPIGRLDYDSEGLLLLTNDGALAAALLHPRFAVPKRYAVLVTPAPTDNDLERLLAGVRLSDGLARAAEVRRLDGSPKGLQTEPRVRGQQTRTVWVELVLLEGRNREARRMCAAVGLDVVRLVRTAFGSISLGRLTPGASRRLSADEVQELRGGRGRATPSPVGASGRSMTGRGIGPKK